MHLADLTHEQRVAKAKELGIPGFRATQLEKHYFTHHTSDPARMTDLPAETRDELVAGLPQAPEEYAYLGQDLLSQIFSRYPQIAHRVPRDLLWFFGGDCLHFMPDEELDLYQALEERRFEAEQNDEPFDWNQEKQLLAMPQDQSKH